MKIIHELADGTTVEDINGRVVSQDCEEFYSSVEKMLRRLNNVEVNRGD